MVVVVIIGILAAIVIPTIARLKRHARNNRFISDLRTFAQAFETYAMKNGSWPPNAGNGVVLGDISGALRDANRTVVNSLGGRWNRDNKMNGVTAGISTTMVTADDAQMTEIDAKMDDGDLSTGNFIKVNGRFTYVLQK